MKRYTEGKVSTPPLSLAVKAYPTPRSRLTGSVCPSRCADKFNNLESVLSRMLWPTPKGSPSGPDYARAGRGQSGGDDLVTAIARMTFPTPTSSMVTEADLIQAKFHSSKRPKYQEAKSRFPTPTAQDAKQVDPPCHRDGKRRTPCLGSHVNKQAETAGGQLNPDWVEWLMGWPIGWTALDSAIEITSLDWSADPADTGEVDRVATGIKNRNQRLQAIGNGQVPLCFAIAWIVLDNDRRKL